MITIVNDAMKLWQDDILRWIVIVSLSIDVLYLVFRPLRIILYPLMTIGNAALTIILAVIALHALSVAGML